MNDLQLFNYEGKQVRTVIRDGEPWWVLRDVCEVLGLTTPARVAERLEEDEVSQTHIIDALGRNQETTIINEAGVYNVIIRSDKPEAKQFKRWITHEVLPAIRKYGMYATTETAERILGDPDFLIATLTALKDERAAKEKLQLQIEADKPKVLFADSVSCSEDTILIGDMAKILKGNGMNTGQKRFFERLREDGYLIKREGADYNMPTQRAMELGLFRIKETAVIHSGGVSRIHKTAKVTGKGQEYFINKYIGKEQIAIGEEPK